MEVREDGLVRGVGRLLRNGLSRIRLDFLGYSYADYNVGVAFRAVGRDVYRCLSVRGAVGVERLGAVSGYFGLWRGRGGLGGCGRLMRSRRRGSFSYRILFFS